LENPKIGLEIYSFVERVVPYPEYAEYANRVISTLVDEFRKYKQFAGIMGILGLLWAASRLFSSMRTVLNTIYRVVGGSILTGITGKLKDFGMVLLVLLYFLLSTMLLPAVDIIGQFAEKSLFLQNLGLGFAGTALTDLIKLPVRVAFVSAFWASLLWLVVQYLFGFYIANLVSIKKIYGAYFLIVALAFWIYYISLVFMIGAEIGQLYREWKTRAD